MRSQGINNKLTHTKLSLKKNLVKLKQTGRVACSTRSDWFEKSELGIHEQPTRLKDKRRREAKYWKNALNANRNESSCSSHQQRVLSWYATYTANTHNGMNLTR